MARLKVYQLIMMKAIIQTMHNDELKKEAELTISNYETRFLDRCNSFTNCLKNNKISNAAYFSVLFSKENEEAKQLLKELSYCWSLDRINDMINIMEAKIKVEKDGNLDSEIPQTNEVTFVSLPITTKENYENFFDRAFDSKPEVLPNDIQSIIMNGKDCQIYMLFHSQKYKFTFNVYFH